VGGGDGRRGDGAVAAGAACDGDERGVRRADYEAGATEPAVNAVIVNHDKGDHGAEEPEGATGGADADVTATPNKKQYLPGEKGSFDVLAVDSTGKPVEADLSFGEVDEALYSVRPDESGIL
jgi:hypothetical protein